MAVIVTFILNALVTSLLKLKVCIHIATRRRCGRRRWGKWYRVASGEEVRLCPLKGAPIANPTFSARFQPQKNLARTLSHSPFQPRKLRSNFYLLIFFFFLLHGAKLFRLHAALSGIAPTSPALCAYEHAFFISTASIFAASACYIAYLSLYGYIPSHWLSLQGLG